MARTSPDIKLDSRNARARLAPDRKHWRGLEPGLAIGYKRGTRGGAWLAKRAKPEGRGLYAETVLGVADDATDADGHAVLNFRQAVEAARTWWQDSQRAAAGLEPVVEAGKPFTVADALDAYFRDRERRGSRGVQSDCITAQARIVLPLGHVEVRKLTTKRIRDWHHGLAASPKLVRTKVGAAKRRTKALDGSDPEAIRKRRSTANRQLTILKAALNHAYHEGKAPSDQEWRRVKRFRAVDVPVIRFLSADEAARLINACQPDDFRDLVRGALATGARYGELVAVTVDDFHAESGTVSFRITKAGETRRVTLANEGVALFERLTVGKMPGELVFTRDGQPWGASHQIRLMARASRRAGLNRPLRFHDLRHVHASLLALGGVPLSFIGRQLGHADLRITSRNYAHLSEDATAAAIRAAMPRLGIAGEPSNVASMRRKQG